MFKARGVLRMGWVFTWRKFSTEQPPCAVLHYCALQMLSERARRVPTCA